MKLSDTQVQILAAAAVHPQRLVVPPAKLAVAAREAVRKSLLAKGLIEAVAVDAADEHEAWATDAGPITYRLAVQEPANRATAAVEAGEAPGGPDGAAEATPPHTAFTESLEASLPQHRPGGLRNAVTAVLCAWDARNDGPSTLEAATASLHAALAGKLARLARKPGVPRSPCQGTKQE